MQPELIHLARKYVWWEPPEETLTRVNLLVCQLMQLGTSDDVARARVLLGDPAFERALDRAPPGILDARS